MLEQVGIRKDASAEQIHALSRESIDLLKQIPADRPVLIQAYYSPEVPREFVEVKSDLLSKLKEYEARERRQDPPEPRADGALLGRGPCCGEAIRDRAATGLYGR